MNKNMGHYYPSIILDSDISNTVSDIKKDYKTFFINDVLRTDDYFTSYSFTFYLSR